MGLIDIDDECSKWCCDGCTPSFRIFRTCTKCGNKRCPRRTDCRYECTGSNEADQQPTPATGERDALLLLQPTDALTCALMDQRDEARADAARWAERVRVLEARIDAVRAAAQ